MAISDCSLRLPSLALAIALAVTADATGELKVFVIAGQSNAEGQAEVATLNKTTGKPLNGTLKYQLTDPRTAKEFAPLWDQKTNDWTVLDNVKVWYNENGSQSGINGSTIPSNPGDASFGSLTVGFGCEGNSNLIGPEYGFGFEMNSALKGEKFVIVKTAWGGKTLAGDFRPPSSVGPDPYCSGSCPNEVGHYYKVMVQDVKQLLAPGVLAKMFPDLAGLRPKLTGFGWFQGWNDGCDLNQTAAYETNMVHLIQDLRSAWSSPDLAVSIAVAGFDGFTGEEVTRTPKTSLPWIDLPPSEKIRTTCAQDRGCRRLDIVLSQFAAANKTRHPELGAVVAVETRGFWREAQYSPNPAQGYHYFHNAETYYLVGKAMAKGMASLLGSR